MTMSGARWTALGLLLAAVATFWQAQSLPRWSFDGPGTGIFPLVLSIIAIALSMLVLITERREVDTPGSDDSEAVSRYDRAAPASDGSSTSTCWRSPFWWLARGGPGSSSPHSWSPSSSCDSAKAWAGVPR
jgi:hypothetical protein